MYKMMYRKLASALEKWRAYSSMILFDSRAMLKAVVLHEDESRLAATIQWEEYSRIIIQNEKLWMRAVRHGNAQMMARGYLSWLSFTIGSKFLETSARRYMMKFISANLAKVLYSWRENALWLKGERFRRHKHFMKAINYLLDKEVTLAFDHLWYLNQVRQRAKDIVRYIRMMRQTRVFLQWKAAKLVMKIEKRLHTQASNAWVDSALYRGFTAWQKQRQMSASIKVLAFQSDLFMKRSALTQWKTERDRIHLAKVALFHMLLSCMRLRFLRWVRVNNDHSLDTQLAQKSTYLIVERFKSRCRHEREDLRRMSVSIDHSSKASLSRGARLWRDKAARHHRLKLFITKRVLSRIRNYSLKVKEDRLFRTRIDNFAEVRRVLRPLRVWRREAARIWQNVKQCHKGTLHHMRALFLSWRKIHTVERRRYSNYSRIAAQRWRNYILDRRHTMLFLSVSLRYLALQATSLWRNVSKQQLKMREVTRLHMKILSRKCWVDWRKCVGLRRRAAWHLHYALLGGGITRMRDWLGDRLSRKNHAIRGDRYWWYRYTRLSIRMLRLWAGRKEVRRLRRDQYEKIALGNVCRVLSAFTARTVRSLRLYHGFSVWRVMLLTDWLGFSVMRLQQWKVLRSLGDIVEVCEHSCFII